MAKVTALMVKQLRERTGLGMMDCKNALEEADGDLDLAIETLRKSSALKAAKKAGRTAADGLLAVRVSDDGKKAAMVEVNIETDFAALNEKFIAFVDKILNAAFDNWQADVASLMAGELESERETLVQEIGENVTVRRVALLSSDEGRIAHYMHSDKRKCTLVDMLGGDEELARGIAMHVTAINPMVTQSSDVPSELVEKEREIYAAQALESGKPADIVEKMVEGRVRKFLAEVSLLDQPFVKDPSVKVARLLADNNAKCCGFIRYEVGEGIEKDDSDFAAEVAAQVQG